LEIFSEAMCPENMVSTPSSSFSRHQTLLFMPQKTWDHVGRNHLIIATLAQLIFPLEIPVRGAAKKTLRKCEV
jgi:hypothetical protein